MLLNNLGCIFQNLFSVFNATYEEVREVFVNVVVSFALATAAVILVLPLLGYKIDLIIQAVDNLIKPNADTAVLDATVTGYAAEPVAASYDAPTAAYSHRRSDLAATARSASGSSSGLVALGARVLNR